MNRISNLIYFNNNRTTPLDEAVKECMSGYSENDRDREAASLNASLKLADLLNADPVELLYTIGTSESIKLFIKAAFEYNKHKGNHIITTSIEHFAVLDSCKALETSGAEITYLKVDKEGLIDPDELRTSIKPTTVLVSIMAANNETGVIQPLEKISEICEEKNILFFSDASQFVGKLRCDVKDLGMSALAFGAHKMYGPDGIGLLYVQEKHKDLLSFIKKNYSPDLNTAQIAGFGKAAEISSQNQWDTSAHISKLKNYFEHQLLDLDGFRINGSTRHRLYNTSNVSFSDGEKMTALKERFDFADNLTKSSYVLEAMGLSLEEIKNSFRFSFGKYNTLDEVKVLVEEIMR